MLTTTFGPSPDPGALAGALLLAGSGVFFLLGFGIAAVRPRLARSGGGSTDEGLRLIGQEPTAWRVLMVVFGAAIVLTAAGLGLLAILLWALGQELLAVLGAMCYALGAATMLVSTAFGIAVTGPVGRALVDGEPVPDWFRAAWRWSEAIYSCYMALAYASLAAFGGAFLHAGVIPSWVAWTTFVTGAGGMLAILTRHPRVGGEVVADFPLIVHLVAIPLGIALMLRG